MDSPFLTAPRDALSTMLVPERAEEQPPLLHLPPLELNAVIASLALGGAERIVLDWARSCAARYHVRLIVLHDVASEWPLPAGVEVTRLGGKALPQRLEELGAVIAAGGNRVVLCHLLSATERDALTRGGAHAIPVLHNAMAGWRETAEAFRSCRETIAVSRDAAGELRATGWHGACAVVHHVPKTPVRRAGARTEWRSRWAVPLDATIIGMIGGVKPQKAYPRALRILATIGRADTYLVIVGGPTGRDGALAWRAILAQARRLGVESRVRLPGFIADAADCLPAFDVLLNTSRYEGVPIATLEALSAGLPVVASAVGGQGELPASGLALLPFSSSDDCWANAVATALSSAPALPAWRGAPAHRMWILFHLPRPRANGVSVLFVTANLNSGGAQRSLVNLALSLNTSTPFEIAVCGHSSSAHFAGVLDAAAVRVTRTADSRDCFDHAEALVRHIAAHGFATACFWNVDAKVKLLVAKALHASAVRLIDVSPGAYAFEEMEATRDFQSWIAYTATEYYARLDAVVIKYRAATLPITRRKVTVISNGVPLPLRTRTATPATSAPRIVMSGRIVPSKFLVEAVEAMRVLWREHANAELHVLGPVEPRHGAYASSLLEAIGPELGRRVFLHGAAADAPERLADFAVVLVLGEHQGCPNAVLEALAAGVPVIANDSGGTRELVLHERTGLLLVTREPRAIAAALSRMLSSDALARRLARAGRKHVEKHFSLQRMSAAYQRLLMPDRRAPCSS
jgi:glycosyltransferase involved in cell wall biosynthesis